MNKAGAKPRVIVWLRFFIVAPVIIAGLLLFSPAYGATIPQRSITISDSTPGANATYLLSFTVPSSQVLGSIQLQFCSNSPLFNDPCAAPNGFDIAGATLTGQTGAVGFVIYPSGTTANTVVLSRVPTPAAAGAVTYTFSGIVNPSTSGEYYARLQTFSSADASGSSTDSGGLALSLNDQVQVTTEVPPYLQFCTGVTITDYDCDTITGSYLNFGNLTSAATASATSVMVSATNALSGFGISVYGTTMTSGNNIINAIVPQDVSRPGVSQFGLNLVANATPNTGQNPSGPGGAAPAAAYSVPDFYRFNSGDLIASTSSADDYRKLTASYIVNIPIGQPIGVYVTTLTYICLANF